MRIEGSLRQEAGVERVYAMYTDARFQQLKCDAMEPLASSVEVSGPAGAATSVVTRTMSSEGLPDFVRSFVRNGIEVTEQLSWADAGPDGSRRAAVLITFAGQPMRMTATYTLSPDGAGTRGSLVGELKAGIPLLGGRIEKATAPLILKALAIEESVGRTWLQD